MLNFNNVKNNYELYQKYCDKLSDHYIIESNNENIKCITFNTEHCYYKHLKCDLDKDYCNKKNKNLLNIIITYLDKNYDFILLQECSYQLLNELQNLLKDYTFNLEFTQRPISHNNNHNLKKIVNPSFI